MDAALHICKHLQIQIKNNEINYEHYKNNLFTHSSIELNNCDICKVAAILKGDEFRGIGFYIEITQRKF